MLLDGRKKEIDYYGVLGLNKGCSPQEIKNAYRRLSRQYNIERQDDAQLHKLFSLISEAYEVLSTPLLRAIYDQYGEEGLKQGVVTPYGWHPPYCYHGDPIKTYKTFYGNTNPYTDLLDVLRNPPKIFEFQAQKGDKRKESTLTKTLALTLEELYLGCHKIAKIQKRAFVDEDRIKTEVREEVLTILVKPGTPAGTKITFTEAGDQGHSLIPGDVEFIVEQKPHEVFKRDGNNLLMVNKLSLIESLVGIIITIKTLDERILRAAITEVITPSYKKIIKHEGMPHIDNPDKKGDLIITFEVEYPTYLPLETKKLLSKALNITIAGEPKSNKVVTEIVTADKLDKMKTPTK